MTPAQTANHVFKWSIMISSVVVLASLGGVFALWLLIELLALLVGLFA